MSRFRLPLLALFCALLWGSSFPAIKYVYQIWDGRDDLGVRLVFAGVRFMLAGLLLVPIRGNPLRSLNLSNWRPLLALAFFQTFLQYLLFYNSLSVSGAVLTSLLVSSGSFWWVLLAPPVLKTPPPSRLQWAVLISSAAGITLAVWKPGAGAGDPLLGAALLLGASFSGAVAVLIVQKYLKGVRATHATALALFFGGSGLVLVSSPSLPNFLALLDWKIVFVTFYLASVSATAFSLWNRLAQQYSANVLSGYRFLIPLCAVILSATLIPGESFGFGTVSGGVIVIVSLVFLHRSQR